MRTQSSLESIGTSFNQSFLESLSPEEVYRLKLRHSPYRYAPKWLLRKTKKYPFLRRLFLSSESHYKVSKAVVGFFFGLVISGVISVLILDRMSISTKIDIYLKTIATVVFVTLNTVSTQGRCVSLVMFPQLVTKSGVTFLKSYLIGCLMGDPVTNLLHNGQQVMHTTSCTTELIKNLTIIRYKMTFEPYQRALMNLKADTSEVKDTLSSMNGVVQPLSNEILDDEEVKYLKEENDYMDEVQNETLRSTMIENKYKAKIRKKRESGILVIDESVDSETAQEIEDFYLKKLEYRCDNVISASGVNCRKVFSKAYDNCYDSMSSLVAWLLCWPMKLTFVCNIATAIGGDAVCEPEMEMPKGWGAGMGALLEAKHKMSGSFKNPAITYTVEKPKLNLDSDLLLAGVGDLKSDFEDGKNIVLNTATFFRMIMTILFVKVVFDAFKYHNRYLREIAFDNVYISDYFIKIDARRHARGLHALLPFKSVEKGNFVFPKKLAPQSKELKTAAFSLLSLVPFLLIVTALVLLDRAFFESLEIIRKKSLVEFTQTGHHEMTITVKGTGMIAKIVRSVVRDFNVNTHMNETHTNKKCLPNAKSMNGSEVFKLYGILLACVFIILASGYGYRARWLVVVFFYPKRHKKRTLYLYNETLKNRKIHFKYMNARVKRLIKENKLDQDASPLLLFRLKFPDRFGWLSKVTASARRRCLICNDPEDIGWHSTGILFNECPTCLYIYCEECWDDIGQICRVCYPSSDEDLGSEKEKTDEGSDV